MKIQAVISVCAALLLSGCMSYSGTYQHDIAYADDGYYDTAETYPSDDTSYDDSSYSDDGYYSNDYYSDAGYYDGSYSGGFYDYGYGDPFGHDGNFGYCSPYDVFCPRNPLAVFPFPIDDGRYWLTFDAYNSWNGWSNYGGYGNRYGYGWPYWGYRHGGRDHRDDHHGRHHHHDDNPPVVVTPPVDGRLFLTPHPRKGIFRPNAMPGPQPADETAENDHPPRNRRDDGSDNAPPMRWRAPVAMTPAPAGSPQSIRYPSGPIQRGEPMTPPDRPRLRISDPARPDRPVVSAPVDRSTRSDPAPEPQSTNTDDNDRTARNHRRNDSGGR